MANTRPNKKGIASIKYWLYTNLKGKNKKLENSGFSESLNCKPILFDKYKLYTSGLIFLTNSLPNNTFVGIKEPE